MPRVLWLGCSSPGLNQNENAVVVRPPHRRRLSQGFVRIRTDGASAGGIQALIRLFEATPCDTGMAFLVVMHLDPTRDSAPAHILGQHTAMTRSMASGSRKASLMRYIFQFRIVRPSSVDRFRRRTSR